jgi:CRP/FNR family transcriptional regulator, cyclic AMP receptor protein
MREKKSAIEDLLKGLNIFCELDAPALVELARLSDERVFSKGETIFEEGSAGDSMMIILSGEVRISHRPEAAREETLSILKKGDSFGEMALLDDLPRSATVIAHTDAFLLEISRRKFMGFVEKDGVSGVKILLSLARNLSFRLREANTKIKAFVTLSQWI